MSSPKGIAWFDIETTGLDPELHEIIDIGIVRTSLDGLHVEDVLDLKVRPNRLEVADPSALKVNGFTEAAWRDSVDLEEAVVRALPLLDGAMIGGHNVGFDIRFFGRAARDLGVRPGWSHRRIDTQSLAWPLLATGVIENTSLDEVCRALGIERPSPHQAINDARAARAVALTLLSCFRVPRGARSEAELEKDARFGAKVRVALASFGVDRNDTRYMATKSRQAPLARAVFEAIDDALREEEAGND